MEFLNLQYSNVILSIQMQCYMVRETESGCSLQASDLYLQEWVYMFVHVPCKEHNFFHMC